MPILYNIAGIQSSIMGSITDAANGLVNEAIGSVSGALGSAIGGMVGQGISSLASFAGLPAKANGSSTRGFGLYTESGSVLIDFSTLIRIDVDSTNQATQAPVEAGGFVMYNKSVTPTVIDVQAAYSCRDDGEMGQVEQALLDLSCSTDLINIVTPTIEFKGYNLESVKFSVEAQGMRVFDLSFIEIKQVTAQYSNAKIAKKQNTGKKNGNQSALSGLMDWMS